MEFKRIKIGDPNSNTLEHLHVSKKDAVKIEDYTNKKSDKMSIASDVLFKVMMQNTKRLKYSAKLISYFVDVEYEELLKNISLISNEYDRENIYSKSERGDYIADIDNFKTLIEVNNYNKTEDAPNIMERNLDFLFRVYGSSSKAREKYDYKQVILINLNNFYFKEVDNWYQKFTINDTNNILLTDKITIINIYLPKLLSMCYTMDEKKLAEVERFLLMLYSESLTIQRR